MTSRNRASKPDFSIAPNGATGCVVVFHEVWGLVKHTEDVCKRVGKLGFAATAPNLYRGYEGILTPDSIQQAMEGVWELSLEERRDKDKVGRILSRKGADQRTREVVSVIYDPRFRDRLLAEALSAVERARAKFSSVSTLGFSIGGGLSMKAAAKSPSLKSAICFYGEPPGREYVQDISSPILAIYAGRDELINKKVPAFVEALIKEGKDLTLKTYPQTKHGFFNDTRKEVYHGSASADAWAITRWFLERTLRRQ